MALNTEKFIDSFVETGDYIYSMKEAGCKEKNSYKVKLQGRELLEQNRDEVDKKFNARLKEGGPKALGVIERLMSTSESDTVRLNAAKEMLDRGAHKIFNEIDTGRTIE